LAAPDQVRQHRVHGLRVEPVEPLIEPARRLEADRRLQEPDGRADARAGRDQRLAQPQLLAETAGMERRAAAEGDHGELRDVATILDCMDARGIGHVLVHHLGDAEGRLVEHQAEGLQRRLRPVGVERDGPAREILGVEPPEREVGVRHRGRLAAAPVTGGAGFRPRRMRADAQPPHPVDPGDGPAARADLHHLDDRRGDQHPRALLEPVGARDLEGVGGLRRAVLDQADLGGGAAHVEAERLVDAMPRATPAA
jgi:hypothetical protein